ncbi:MAG: hypothetical protein IJU64_04885 [Bacilli bacterium]|nr:hypothetical protein [Bacilli bacterium]
MGNTKLVLRFAMSEIVQLNFILEDKDISASCAGVIFKYFACESLYKKLLIKKKGKLTPKQKKRLGVNLPEVIDVMNHFGVDADTATLERIFGSEDRSLEACSVKKLRDRFVHGMTDYVLKAMIERADSINADLDYFLGLFK